jgi:hypothetical protein
MESSLRKNLLKEAVHTQLERNGLVGGGLLIGGAVILTALTSPWLGPVWAAAAGLGGVALSLTGAQGLLRNQQALPDLARRAVLQHHTPREVPPELLPYVNQAVQSSIEIIERVEPMRGQPLYAALSEVVDTVGSLLDKICSMSERIVVTDRLFDSIQQQVSALPGSRLQGDAKREFDRNLLQLQGSIDTAREQIVSATASLQQIAVQTLMIQAQDAALVDDTTGSLIRMAEDQADLLQTRISAMEDVARSTEAMTGRLLKG